MKNTLLGLLLVTAPTLHAASLLQDAQAIEKQMDETTPAIASSDAKKLERVTPEMAQRQTEVVDAVSDLTTAAAKAKSIDDKTFEAICHVIARNGLYDQMGESVDPKFSRKYRDRIDKVFNKFQAERIPYEKNRKFDEGRLEQVRIQLDLGTGNMRGVDKPAGKRGDLNGSDDGAALSPCDSGTDCPALAVRTLAPPAKRSLVRLPSTAAGPKTAGR